MSEHHGLDLDAIQKARGSHSIFAPSGSKIWLNCGGALIPSLSAPDNAGIDAAEGTVAHGVAEKWLNRIKQAASSFRRSPASLVDECYPEDLIGTVEEIKEAEDRVFSFIIDAEMLSWVREYIEWCVKLPGEHYIETKVFFSQITPIPKQGGTADHCACEWQRLTITDLKYGKGVRVYADQNTQALLYALGFFYEWDWLYNFQEIVLRIAQPRIDHWDTWTITRAELLSFADYAKVRAYAAWDATAPRTPGDWCKDGFCKIRETCPALLALAEGMADDTFDDLDEVEVDENGAILAHYTVLDQEKAQTQALTEAPANARFRDPQGMNTATMARVYRFRGVMEAWFRDIEAELISRADNGEEVPGFKLVQGREGKRAWVNPRSAERFLLSKGVDLLDIWKSEVISPAQSETALRKAIGTTKRQAALLLAPEVIRAAGKPTLASVLDDRDQLPGSADVFDDLDADAGL